MNNISADNSKDIFNIDIPAFDSGAMPTRTVAPDKNVYRSEYDAVANKSFISFGVMLLCILIFLFFVFIFKKRDSALRIFSTILDGTRKNFLARDFAVQKSLAFLEGLCYHKWVDCPYRDGWVVFYIDRFGVGAPGRLFTYNDK